MYVTPPATKAAHVLIPVRHTRPGLAAIQKYASVLRSAFSNNSASVLCISALHNFSRLDSIVQVAVEPLNDIHCGRLASKEFQFTGYSTGTGK
jgi:hypothetical protein